VHSRPVSILLGLLRQGRPLVVAWSGGKDSSVTLDLAFRAALRARDEGLTPRIVVSHADTGVENPEMRMHCLMERGLIRRFAKANGLDVSIKISRPTLASTWAVRVITGTMLPRFPGASRDCSRDWKVLPQRRLMKKVLAELRAEGVEPVTVVGTRYDESTSRQENMSARGESADDIWADCRDDANISPIAHWSDADVWRHLGRCARGELESYSDFAGLHRLYRDGAAETRVEDGVEIPSCRYGCSVCTIGEDRTMRQLLAGDPERYGYMQGLYDLQRYLLDTRHDMTMRQWVGRAIDDQGWISIGPDTYGPAMQRRLLAICCTLDAREREAAASLGINPRFQLIDDATLVAIDALWGLHANQPAHHALRIHRDVHEKGFRMDPPVVSDPEAKAPRPKTRYVNVGTSWRDVFPGLNDHLLFADRDTVRCMGQRVLSCGDTIMDVNTEPQLEVDEEGLSFFMDMKDEYVSRAEGLTPMSGYLDYVHLGFIPLAPKQVHDHHIALQRAQCRMANGLAGLDCENPRILEELLKRTEPDKVRRGQTCFEEDFDRETTAPGPA